MCNQPPSTTKRKIHADLQINYDKQQNIMQCNALHVIASAKRQTQQSDDTTDTTDYIMIPNL